MNFNLTWWRKRPSVHVSQEYIDRDNGMVDMDRLILDLDMIDSPLVRLMETLTNVRRSTLPEPHGLTAIGEIVRQPKTGRTGRIVERRLKYPDDWFSREHEVVVEWDEPFRLPPAVWLEDEFFPRLRAA